MPRDCQIYQSNSNADPNDDSPVTGVDIAAGATLTLQNSSGATGCIRVDNDIVNDGTIKTELLNTDPVLGGSVALYASSYFGSGPIDTSGKCGAGLNPDAEDIAIYASTAIFNQGDLNAAGADCETAGNGGNIGLYVGLYVEPPMVGLVAAQAVAVNPDSNNLWNAGTLNTSGGNSTTAGGGDGGDTYFYLEVNDPAGGGSLISAGAIDTSGGDGLDGGGTGGDVSVDLSGPPADGDGIDSSNIFVLGGIDTHGGSVTDPNGDGGDAGDLSMTIEAGGGSLELLGFSNIDATGGDGAGGGGSGGLYVGMGNYDIFDANITNQANIDVSGGDALVDGDGGEGGNIGAVLYEGAGDIINSGNLTSNGAPAPTPAPVATAVVSISTLILGTPPTVEPSARAAATAVTSAATVLLAPAAMVCTLEAIRSPTMVTSTSVAAMGPIKAVMAATWDFGPTGTPIPRTAAR